MPNYKNNRFNRTSRYEFNYNDRNNYDDINRGSRYNERSRGGATRSQHYGTTNNPEDFAKMVETVVLRILKEKDNSPPHGNVELRNNTLHNDRQQRATTINIDGTTRSVNPQFHTMWKSLYKTIQIQHHLDNWSDLPKSIKRDLTHLAKDIRPPDPVDGLSDDIQKILTDAGLLIQKRVQTHLLTRLTENKKTLADMMPLDTERAADVAFKHLNQRLGSRITDLKQKINTELEQIGRNIITQRQKTPSTSASSKRPRTEDTPPHADTVFISTLQPTTGLTAPPASATPSTTTTKPSRITTKKSKGQPFEIFKDTTTIIVSDECLKNTSEDILDPGWQLLVMPGSELHTIADQAVFYAVSNPVDVIIAGGLNNRNDTYHQDTDATLGHVTHRIKQGCRISFMGHSINEHLETEIRNNVNKYNQKLENLFKDNYVQPVLPYHVLMTNDERHYSTATADYIVNVLRGHLRQPW